MRDISFGHAWETREVERLKTKDDIAQSVFPRPAESARWGEVQIGATKEGNYVSTSFWAMIGFSEWNVNHAAEMFIAKTAVNQANAFITCVNLVQ